MFEGGGATVRSDIYSLGVLLFHLATGSYPVQGATVTEIRDCHRIGGGTALASLRRDLPSPLVRAVERALARDPARRFESADEMAGPGATLSAGTLGTRRRSAAQYTAA
jgi:serine/threonine protein kinase